MKQLTALLIALLTLPMVTAAAPLDYLPALQGDYFKHESKSVGRPFHIYVAFPESYAAQPQTRYPVVYLLDGDSTFPILATYHLFLNYDEGVPQAIVVGIAYGSFDPAINKRGYDFSPDGAAAFQAFLKQELIPEIDRRYRTDPARRVLFGQSRGGYMVLYSAFTDPDLFWGRIASNAAIDLGRDLFFSKPTASTRKDLGLVVTSASRDIPRLRKSALEWFAAWERRTDASWQVKTVTLEGATHAADITNSYRAGMVWLFKRDGRGLPAAELPEKSIAGTYEILVCKGSCPATGDQDVFVKGRLVLFAANFDPPALTRFGSLRHKVSSIGYEAPNACFELEKLPGRNYQGFAGLTKAGLTAWSTEGDELQLGLYRSPDAIYKVTVGRTTTGFDGKGESWGAGVAAAPADSTVDKVVLRRIGAADLSQCPHPAD